VPSGGGPQALADIVVGVERTEHRGLLEHHLGARGQLQLAHLGRAVEGFVAQADAVLANSRLSCTYRL
jgi:endonuclease/exonuclease/phosphatase family metal-dependent hydrolase